jgi:uncharacterized membrane protein
MIGKAAADPPPSPAASSPRGPAITFAIAVLATVSTLGIAAAVLPENGAAPAAATLLFVAAGLAALTAWIGRPSAHQDGLSYWDVAGALTFIGICVAATIEPDRLVELVEATDRRK